MKIDNIDIEKLRDQLGYNQETGVFTWLFGKSGINRNKTAACPITNPVHTIMFYGEAYSVLQLAWVFIHGHPPRSKILPINGNSCDARACNLRERAAKTCELTQERLKELLTYHHETGLFTRNIRTSNRINVGDVAGCVHSSGYWHIKVDGKMLKGHRLAWLYTYGCWPEGEIDHINGDPSDNRIGNLRDVSHTHNVQNLRKPRRDNTSGFLGVYAGNSGWVAAIQTNKSPMKIGTFSTPEEAHQAYLEAKRRLHPTSTI